MIEYTLIDATEADKERFMELHELCYREVVERQFGDWDPVLQAEFFEAKWEVQRIKRIVVNGETMGSLVVDVRVDHVFLGQIQVAPKMQGQGLGSAIVRRIQVDASKLRVPVRLQVLRENRAAALYKRLGFVAAGELEHHLLFEWNA